MTVYVRYEDNEAENFQDQFFFSRSPWLRVQGCFSHRNRRVSASADHLGVITAGENLYMMGSTSCGKLGMGDLVMDTHFHKALGVETLHMFEVKVKSIACGMNHTLCLTSKGVYSWGSNKYGQLGLGENFGDTTKPVVIPLLNQENPHLASFLNEFFNFRFQNFVNFLTDCCWRLSFTGVYEKPAKAVHFRMGHFGTAW